MSLAFHGLPTQTLENEHLRVDYCSQAGPRLVRLLLPGHPENLLAELPHHRHPTPYGEYRILGGHRLWQAPEDILRTYIPDNDGLTVEQTPQSARLTGPVEPLTDLQKSIEIRLHPDRPALTLVHALTNRGAQPVECSPWSITQHPLGGQLILPQPVGPLAPGSLLPNRQIVLWPYTRWEDTRLQMADDVVLLHARPDLPPCKLGYTNRAGWLAYLLQDVLFVKRFDPQPDLPHPDFGCNVETFCDNAFIESEIVAPLARLEPGQAATHTETWEFYTGLDVPLNLQGARQLVSSLNLASQQP